MKKYILAYCTQLDLLLQQSPEGEDWNAVREKHLTYLAFFQHERLIHLLVTMLVAILLMIALGIGLLGENPAMLAVGIVLLLLFIPYIAHYYFLENKVQYMYTQYDRILEKTTATRRFYDESKVH